MSSFIVFTIVLLSLMSLATAHTITIPASTKDCYFETLHKGDKMSITYQVGDGGHLDIDFMVYDPSDRILDSSVRQSTGTFSLVAGLDGRYTYCFSNEMSSVTDKVVSFNVHGTIYVYEDESHTDPLEREILELADGLAAIRDEQEYIVMRERTHRNSTYYISCI
ncbi:13887_t:CDS:2 [Acaulospora morrowiae]|uniref:13887_t:CDS:1 n=1 Tax=Acaulospora morrowiae TaxID=94023 RepID=A0A9N8WFM0_9GLOM|nr:13887_t:CDS:2 [Acaulospora morrowiae]